MAKQKSVAREPMLYITQPEFQSAKPRMQSTYRSIPKEKASKSEKNSTPQKKENEEGNPTSQKIDRNSSKERRNKGKDKFGLKTSATENKENQSKQPSPWDEIKKDESDVGQPEAEEQKVESTEDEDTDQEEQSRVSFSNRKRRERFKDMTLEEKVEYFVHLPSSVPRMKCEVYTDEKSYRGWIQDYQDGIVTMKILQRPFRVEVPFETIESIELKGF